MELQGGMYIYITFHYAAFCLLFDHIKHAMCGHCPIFASHVSTPLYACTELYTSVYSVSCTCLVL